MAKTLIVLGAGPKAVAICAKAAALKAVGLGAPDVIVVERNEVAAHWCGRWGYTDGLQSLGTPPEKDVGFPYSSTCWGTNNATVNAAMIQYSWQSFLIRRGEFSTWLDRGRAAPLHRKYGQYLNWVANEIGMQVVHGEVLEIQMRDGMWDLTCRRPNSGEHVVVKGNGLVVTGPGEPLAIPGQPESHARVFDGKSFWRDFTALRESLPGPASVAVVGAGETAGSIAVALHRCLPPDSSIRIVNPYGILYSRGESYTENQQFSDPQTWTNMSANHRRELIRRSDRGVFSMQAQQILNSAQNVRVIAGQVETITHNSDLVRLEVRYDSRSETHSFDYVVVARGFFPLAFLRFLEAGAATRLGKLIGLDDALTRPIADEQRKKIVSIVEDRIDNDLSLAGSDPKLHLPMLAGVAQGPGFPNLSCLGLTADRILSPYVGGIA